MSERLVTFIFDEPQAQRLDKFLVTCLPEFSRSRLQSLIKDGCVDVDGITAHKTGEMLAKQSIVEVRIPPPKPSKLTPEDILLDIISESDERTYGNSTVKVDSIMINENIPISPLV